MKHLGAIGICTLAILALLLAFSRSDSAHAQTFSVVSAGQNQTCALTSSGGGVWCWGRNNEGELGIGTTAAPYGQTTSPVPVCASGVWNGNSCNGGSSFTGVYAISTGAVAAHSCATIVWYILECWGLNANGQVGNNSIGAPVLNPTAVACQSTSASCNSTYHFLAGIVAIAAGSRHTCALDNGGYVWCWGANAKGQLGDGTTTGRAYATRVCATGSGQDCPSGTLLSGVTAIGAGQDVTCALLSSGGVKCWGYNHDGQLGDGTTTDRSLPVGVSGLSSGVAALAVGQSHACVVLTSGGTVKCWGNNDYGAIGDASQVAKATPVAPFGTVTASAITAGANYTCVLATTPLTVRCWGQNGFGELGNGGGSPSTSYGVFAATPVQWSLPPTAPTPAWTPQPSALSAGGAHTCAIISSHVECWGWNGFGQLGIGGTSTDFFDNTTSWLIQDTDKDGCADSRELNPATGSEARGGRRDPTNFWDFFDTPDASNVRDRKIDNSDVSRVAARYLTSGSPSGDPLLPPPPTGYSTAFDRTSVGPNYWNLGPPDGVITVSDILAVQYQLNHTCQ